MMSEPTSSEITAARYQELITGYQLAAKKSLDFLATYMDGFAQLGNLGLVRTDADALTQAITSVQEASARGKSLSACQDLVILIREYDQLVRTMIEALGHAHNAVFNFHPTFTPEESRTLYGALVGDIRHTFAAILFTSVPALDPERIAQDILKARVTTPSPPPASPVPFSLSLADLRRFLESA